MNRETPAPSPKRQPAKASQEWIKARLAEIGKDQKGLARAMGLPPSRITDIIGGARKISPREIVFVAKHLEMSEIDVLGYYSQHELMPKELRQCMVRGYVERGTWRKPAAAGPELSRLSPLHPDKRFPAAEQVVFEIRDHSAAPTYPLGSYVLCIAFDEMTKRQPKAGDHILAENAKEDTVEFTVWSVTSVQPKHIWLAPLENPPKQEPIRLEKPKSNKGMKIAALIVAAHVIRAP